MDKQYVLNPATGVTASFGNHNILLDRRKQPEGYFIPRLFSILEIERLFREFSCSTGYRAYY